jgi:hypothetical protein
MNGQTVAAVTYPHHHPRPRRRDRRRRPPGRSRGGRRRRAGPKQRHGSGTDTPAAAPVPATAAHRAEHRATVHPTPAPAALTRPATPSGPDRASGGERQAADQLNLWSGIVMNTVADDRPPMQH